MNLNNHTNFNNYDVNNAASTTLKERRIIKYLFLLTILIYGFIGIYIKFLR